MAGAVEAVVSGGGFFGFLPRFFFSGGPPEVVEAEGRGTGAGDGKTGAENERKRYITFQ